MHRRWFYATLTALAPASSPPTSDYHVVSTFSQSHMASHAGCSGRCNSELLRQQVQSAFIYSACKSLRILILLYVSAEWRSLLVIRIKIAPSTACLTVVLARRLSGRDASPETHCCPLITQSRFPLLYVKWYYNSDADRHLYSQYCFHRDCYNQNT